MRRLLVAIALFSIVACGESVKNNNTSNSTQPTAEQGNSNGSATIGADTAHMDTSLGNIKSDSSN